MRVKEIILDRSDLGKLESKAKCAIYVPNKSESKRIQSLLFQAGYIWQSGANKPVSYAVSTWIIVNDNNISPNYITYSNDPIKFHKNLTLISSQFVDPYIIKILKGEKSKSFLEL